MGSTATTEKRHSHVNNDKLQFPRANLQTITTLGNRNHMCSGFKLSKSHASCVFSIFFFDADMYVSVNVGPGKGEFGEVLLCKAKGIEESEEEVVVLVKSLQTRDEQLQLDYRREAEMFAKLSHPNVARLLGVCREAEPHYMILDYYDLVNQGNRSIAEGSNVYM